MGRYYYYYLPPAHHHHPTEQTSEIGIWNLEALNPHLTWLRSRPVCWCRTLTLCLSGSNFPLPAAVPAALPETNTHSFIR